MKFTAYARSTGEVLFSGEAVCPEVFETETTGVVLDVAHPRGWLDSQKTLHVMPPRPSPAHVWDWETKSYRSLMDLSALIGNKTLEISVERDKRIAAPIEYQGVLLDAGPSALASILAKINELTMKMDLGLSTDSALLVWRDASNNQQTFSSAQEFKAWLQGLYVSITERSSSVYQWSWDLKDQAKSSKSEQDLAQITW